MPQTVFCIARLTFSVKKIINKSWLGGVCKFFSCQTGSKGSKSWPWWQQICHFCSLLWSMKVSLSADKSHLLTGVSREPFSWLEASSHRHSARAEEQVNKASLKPRATCFFAFWIWKAASTEQKIHAYWFQYSLAAVWTDIALFFCLCSTFWPFCCRHRLLLAHSFILCDRAAQTPLKAS